MLGVEASETLETLGSTSNEPNFSTSSRQSQNFKSSQESVRDVPNPIVSASISSDKVDASINKANTNKSFNFRHDVCVVFPADPMTKNFFPEGLEVINKIASVVGQQNIFIHRSRDLKLLFVLLVVTSEKMKNFADLNEFYFLANPIQLKERCLKGWPEVIDQESGKVIQPEIKPLILTEDRPDITKYNPYEFIYLKYEHEDSFADLYYKNEKDSDVFTDRFRIRVIKQLLENSELHGGCHINFPDLMETKIKRDYESGEKVEVPIVMAVYPLHNKVALDELIEIIFSNYYLYPWIRQPLLEISNYFGEKIALYYTFLGHFSYFLTYPAIIGLIFQILIAGFRNTDFVIVPFYCVFIVLWGVLMLEYWKRKEKKSAMKLGMLNFEETESYRPEFKQDEILNLTGGDDILYFPEKKRNNLIAQSYFFMFLFCGCIVGTTACIYVFRGWLSGLSLEGAQSASIVASILNAIQIQIYTFIFGYFSDWLTDRENQETETKYEDSMIAKNFLFAFVNSYNSFFYIAFFASNQPRIDYPGMPSDAPQASWTGQCGAPTCMQTLAINLGIVLCTAIIVGNFSEVVLPYIFYKLKKNKDEKEFTETGEVVSVAENDYNKENYDNKGILGDYLEVVISFGYMTMFISALPGASAIVFLSLWIEVKSDIWKLTHLVRRPWPNGAEDIGTWQDVMDLVMTSAVITNAAMIVFTMQIQGLDSYSDYTKFWIFIGFFWVMFSLQAAIRAAIPDVPFAVEIQEKRQEFLNRKLIKKEIDDDDDALIGILAKRSAAATWSRKDEIALNLNSFIKEHIDA